MLISLNWIRDFVELPDGLDPRALAEKFTRTTAEVDGVEHIATRGPAPGGPNSKEQTDDWIIEIDNKSITHRPDLWGHYGIAREIAAIVGQPLKTYPVSPLDELTSGSLPQVPIQITDPAACRRYSGIVLEGVPTQPAPLWMQLRLERVGQRPISGLVDLTNYIMLELGQPMHAFDAGKVRRIEVDWGGEGEAFRTLDGVERKLPAQALMIKSGGKSVALAGIMGGLDTEVTQATTSLLLESANFDPATVRRTAQRLGLRTDASARFEKSLDPLHTVLAIQRFLHLARSMYPNLRITGRLSDAFPKPFQQITVAVNPRHVTRTVGREVPLDEAKGLLSPLGFSLVANDSHWHVHVPPYRATNDVSIEADVIEELMRRVGYDTLAPAMPVVSVRRVPPNAIHEIEQRTLEYFTMAHAFHEIHGYLWYDSSWIRQLGYEPGPCLELKNASAEGLHRLRRSLMPGLLAAVAKNRFHFPAFSLIEIGSVFDATKRANQETRHVGLVVVQRGKQVEERLLSELKGAVSAWAWRRFGRSAAFSLAAAAADRPWEHPHRTATVMVGDVIAGRIGVVDMGLRRAMDEHLVPWGIAWAEVALDPLALLPPLTERIGAIPAFPLVEMDFSFLVPRATRYGEVAQRLRTFEHPLLKCVRFVGSYEGDKIAEDRRSLTIRTVIGDDARTLVDEDATSFRQSLEQHLLRYGFEIRQ